MSSVRKRADAERNIAAIVDAGIELLATNPGASMAEIAQAAGVGRVTLYAHFASRETLLDAIVRHAIDQTVAQLAADEDAVAGEPADVALARILRTQWKSLDRYGRLRAVAVEVLGEQKLRRRHDPVLDRLRKLIVRGQNDGVFRTDLPQSWLVTAIYSLLHAAADEVAANRMTRSAAPDVLIGTVLGLLTTR